MVASLLRGLIEYEATLVVCSDYPLEIVRELRELGAVDGLRLEPRGSLSIHDVYFDTCQRELSARNHALRVRQTGSEWRVTLKGPSSTGESALAARPELELPWSRESLDTIMKEVCGLDITLGRGQFYADNPLASMLEFGLKAIQDRIVSRTVRDVAPGGLAWACELAIDSVTYRFHGTEVLHHEVEIEAGELSGTDTVETFVGALISRFPETLRPWSHSKLATGRAVEELMKLGALENALDANQCLMPSAYDVIDAFLARDR